MPKDYQEMIAFAEIDGVAVSVFQGVDSLTLTVSGSKEYTKQIDLTTYGNARELAGIEKVEKGVPAEKEHDREDSIFEDSNKAAHNICRNITLDHIERVKKELK
jgi:hypothetical protein